VNEAIEYKIEHFVLPPIPSGPFIGKGLEVDAMWEWATDGSTATFWHFTCKTRLIGHSP